MAGRPKTRAKRARQNGGGWTRAYNNPGLNAYPPPGQLAIPGRFPEHMFVPGSMPKLANWTGYPEFSYEQFSRANPSKARQNPTIASDVSRGLAIASFVMERGKPVAIVQYPGGPARKLHGAAAKALATALRKTAAPAFRNPQYPGGLDGSVSRPVYSPVVMNAGPYLPGMFPYGAFGRAASYTTTPEKEPAKKNPKKPTRRISEVKPTRRTAGVTSSEQAYNVGYRDGVDGLRPSRFADPRLQEGYNDGYNQGAEDGEPS